MCFHVANEQIRTNVCVHSSAFSMSCSHTSGTLAIPMFLVKCPVVFNSLIAHCRQFVLVMYLLLLLLFTLSGHLFALLE
uniref:Uncharacterized protein n=1 Tax=Anguilla anguilla TaxID=7936 RepID=A0A0E9WLS3_ANGAN